MAVTGRTHDAMKKKYEKHLETAEDPIEILRAHCLSRGASGIKGLGIAFRIRDEDGTGMLTQPEFAKFIREYGVVLDPSKTQELYKRFDCDNNGTIDFDEFLKALRPPMSGARRNLINLAFKKLDRDNDGIITIQDLKGVYKVDKHPKYLSGEMTEDECLEKFLDNFEISGHAEGKVTPDEFLNYYAGVSASIDSDPYFDLMMRHAWKL